MPYSINDPLFNQMQHIFSHIQEIAGDLLLSNILLAKSFSLGIKPSELEHSPKDSNVLTLDTFGALYRHYQIIEQLMKWKHCWFGDIVCDEEHLTIHNDGRIVVTIAVDHQDRALFLSSVNEAKGFYTSGPRNKIKYQ